MEKSFLEDCLRRGLSLDAIGEVTGRHPSMVSYWLKKYGLEAGGAERRAPKGGVDQAALMALVAEGLTLREIAEKLDRSPTTVRHWLAKFGLETVRQSSLLLLVMLERSNDAVHGMETPSSSSRAVAITDA